MRNYFLLLFCSFILFSGHLNGQDEKPHLEKIEVIMVQGKVIGILKSHKSLAVVQITRAEEGNMYELVPKQEVLVEFVYGTEGYEDPKLVELKPGDLIRAEIAGKYNSKTNQNDYRIFRYWPVPTEKSSSQ